MNDVLFRNEIKFIIDHANAEIIKSQIATICSLDRNVSDKGYYDIKSLYFDTIDDRYYQENLAGVNVRHKYRIRVYNDNLSFINLERKSTEAGLKHKDSSKLDINQLEEILSGNILTDCRENQQVLHEFQLEHLNSFLLPKTIVCYRRIPYIYSVGNVRITFDYQICASNEIDRFSDPDMQYTSIIDDGFLVLEVKYDEVLPKTIRDILNGNGLLAQTAFSKYSVSRELIC